MRIRFEFDSLSRVLARQGNLSLRDKGRRGIRNGAILLSGLCEEPGH
jgi:hypothetical protein